MQYTDFTIYGIAYAVVCSHITGIPIYPVSFCWPRKYSMSRFQSADTLRPYMNFNYLLTFASIAIAPDLYDVRKITAHARHSKQATTCSSHARYAHAWKSSIRWRFSCYTNVILVDLKNVWVMKNGTGRPDWLLWKPYLCIFIVV